MREDWTKAKYKDFLDYIQPTNYLVSSTAYDNDYKTPVLTAGKTFILGYTNEENGIFEDTPVIIFDDFTTASKYVNFHFKAKSSAMKILKPTSALVNLKFIYYSMQVNQINADTHKRYWISIYAEHELLIPPLLEQNAIVSKIEQLFSELDNSIENLKTAQVKLKVYRQAVLKKAFEGEFTKEWREKQTNLPTADELLEQIKKEREEHYKEQLEEWKEAVKEWEENRENSKKPKKPVKIKPENVFGSVNGFLNISVNDTSKYIIDCLHSTPKFTDEGKFCVDTTCITNNGIIWEKIRYVSEETYNERISRLEPKNGDILFAREGTVGTTVLLSNDVDICLGQRIMMFRLINSILPKYFMYYFQSNSFITQYKPLISGTTSPHLNIRDIKLLSFPVCSSREQTVIVQEIESRLSVCDKIEETIEMSLAKSEALRQSILKKAFEGKLLSEQEIQNIKNHPEYESAEVLLERIKKEREE